MGLSKEQADRIKGLSDGDLTAESGDASYLTEASLRLKRSTERLTSVLIWLTALLVVLTAVLIIDPVRQLIRNASMTTGGWGGAVVTLLQAVTALNLCGAVAGLLAAWFWFRSAMLKPPTELKGAAGYGGPVTVDTGPLVAFAQKSAQLNKVAALWTALAAFLAGAAIIVQQISGVG